MWFIYIISDVLLGKISFPFDGAYQSQTVSLLGVKASAHFPFSFLEFCIIRISVGIGLVHTVIVSVRSYSSFLLYLEDVVFYSSPLTFTFFECWLYLLYHLHKDILENNQIKISWCYFTSVKLQYIWGYYQDNKIIIRRIQSKGNPCALLVRLKVYIVITKNCIIIIMKLKSVYDPTIIYICLQCK